MTRNKRGRGRERPRSTPSPVANAPQVNNGGLLQAWGWAFLYLSVVVFLGGSVVLLYNLEEYREFLDPAGGGGNGYSALAFWVAVFIHALVLCFVLIGKLILLVEGRSPTTEAVVRTVMGGGLAVLSAYVGYYFTDTKAMYWLFTFNITVALWNAALKISEDNGVLDATMAVLLGLVLHIKHHAGILVLAALITISSHWTEIVKARFQPPTDREQGNQHQTDREQSVQSPIGPSSSIHPPSGPGQSSNQQTQSHQSQSQRHHAQSEKRRAFSYDSYPDLESDPTRDASPGGRKDVIG